MQQGWPWRNLTALLTLDAIRTATTDRLSMPGLRYR